MPLSQQLKLSSSELEAEVKILKAKKSKEFPPRCYEWLDWLLQFDRGTTFPNFKILMRSFL